MKITASMLSEFATLGLTPEQMAGVSAVIEREEEARLLKDRNRKRISKEFHGTDRNSAERTGAVSPKEKSPTPPKEITPSLSSEASASSDSRRTPADELAEVLDREHADAVVAHRKAMGKKLTAHAARLLAAKFVKAPDPNAGADQMIASGWQGFDAAWMTRATGPPGGRSQNGFAAIAIEKGLELLNEQFDHHRQAKWPADAGPANPGAAPRAGGADERGDGRAWPDGSASRQGDQRGRTPGHGGPVIDLEAIPRRA